VYSSKLLTKYERNIYIKNFLFYYSDKLSFAKISANFREKNRYGPNGILRGPRETDSLNKLEAENLLSDSLEFKCLPTPRKLHMKGGGHQKSDTNYFKFI